MDVQAYGDAVLKFCDDMELYEKKRAACAGLQPQFYDVDQSWGATLKKALTGLAHK